MPEIVEPLIDIVNAGNKFTIKRTVRIPVDKQLPNDLQITIYRILQEQINNIIKYTGATQVEIDIRIQNDAVQLRIADNGCGFDVKMVKKELGLKSMKRRIKMGNGEFDFYSSPGNGCEIIAELPSKIK